MNWKSFLAAFALTLVGVFGGAQANNNANDVKGGDEVRDDGVLSLFGRTLCLAHAPAMAACDWRVPAAPPTTSDATQEKVESKSFTLFGKRFCFSVGCDDQPRAPAPSANVARLLGLSICLGDAPPAQRCDIRLGGNAATDDPSSDRRVSL